jgi:hypothetical protein
MQYQQLPNNPYAPYGAVPMGVAAFDPTGHRPQLRIWLLLTGLVAGCLYVSGIGLYIAAFVVHDRSLQPIFLLSGAGLLMIGALLIYVKLGIALYWLHGAWKWVPMDQRWMRDGKRVAPNDVFMLLIPYYHFYWMFPINLGLCDVMERLRAHYVREPRVDPPPRDTAMWAAICELVPFVNFFVAPFLWASYMRRIDVMHEEIRNAYGAG